MRDVTPEMIADVFSPKVSDSALLLTLSAEGLDEDLFLTNHPDGVTSNAQFYEFFPFTFAWAGASEGKPIKEAKLEIFNKDERIMYAIRQATGHPLISVQLVRLSNPDLVEIAMTDARIYDVEAANPSVTATIRPRSFATEPACKARYVFARTPSLF